MSLPISHLAYVDCFEAFDRAINEPRGIRIQVKDRDAAYYFRLRLHQARKIDRKRNAENFEEGHKLHGASIYDPFAVRIHEEDGKWWVYIEQHRTLIGEVESLPEETFTTVPQIEHEPMRMIESPETIKRRA